MKMHSKLTPAIFAGTLLAVSHGAATAQTVAVATGAPGKVHLLPATMETTQLGWYDNAQKPVLTIKPGDSVGITAGLPSGRPGTTSLFQVQEV